MSEEIDPAALKATKDALGSYVKKPPLSDKLLSKPPFKFLHDVFSVVIRDHGLMEGLFKAEEMNPANFKDKESKVAYIQKVIDALEFVSGEKLSVKPGKVVAGLEAGKTNILLQAIGKALTAKVDSSGAVAKVLAGEKFGGGKDKSSKKSKDGASPKKAKAGASLTDATNKSPDKKSRDKDKKRSKKDEGEEKPKKPKKDGDKPKKSKKDSKSEDERKASKERKKDVKPEKDGDVERPAAAEEGIAPPTRPTSGRPTSSRPVSGRPTSQRPLSGRPGSSRPVMSPSLAQQPPPPLPEETDVAGTTPDDLVTLGGAATLGEEPEPSLMQQISGDTGEIDAADLTKDITVSLNETGRGFSARPRSSRSARPSSARPAAPRLKPRAAIEQEVADAAPSGQAAPPVMFEEDDDDDDNFVVEEKHALPDPGLAAVMQPGDNLADKAAGGDHGLLVSQILETKKTMEEEITSKTQTRPDHGSVVDRTRFLDKDTIRREVVRLRESIQKVTKSANPLGKMMDFLQEDVDSMQRELDKWRSENKEITQQIRAEVQATNNSVEPLKAALAEYEHNIRDQLDRISTVRGATLVNEEKITKLMGGVMNVAAAAD